MCKSCVVPGSYGQHVVASLSEGDRQTTYYIPKASSLGPGSDFSGDKDYAQGVRSFGCFFSERRCFAPHSSMLRCTLSQAMEVTSRSGTFGFSGKWPDAARKTTDQRIRHTESLTWLDSIAQAARRAKTCRRCDVHSAISSIAHAGANCLACTTPWTQSLMLANWENSLVQEMDFALNSTNGQKLGERTSSLKHEHR